MSDSDDSGKPLVKLSETEATYEDEDGEVHLKMESLSKGGLELKREE